MRMAMRFESTLCPAAGPLNGFLDIIVRLIELVKNQGLQELDIQLPYALEDEQLMTIQAECRNAVSMTQYDERLHVVITVKEPKRK